MKSVYKGLIKLAALCSLSAAPLFAQVDNGMEFTTSFPFSVDNVAMPAGSYTITSATTGEELLLIQSVDHKHAAFFSYVPTRTNLVADQGKVLFDEVGNKDFLRSFTVAGDETGGELLPTKAEKQLARTEHQVATKEIPVGSGIAGN